MNSRIRFTEARLKIEWAEQHIANLKERIAGLPDRCTAVVEINPASGNERIKYDLPDTKAATDIALMIGDAAHNLRCALDYAWRKVLERAAPTIIDNSTKFPVRESIDKLKAALQGRKIDTLCVALYKLVIEEIQPYDGGNIAIWPIHKINNRDKHCLLTTLVQYGGVTGIYVEDDSGETDNDGFTTATKHPSHTSLTCPLAGTSKTRERFLSAYCSTEQYLETSSAQWTR